MRAGGRRAPGRAARRACSCCASRFPAHGRPSRASLNAPACRRSCCRRSAASAARAPDDAGRARSGWRRSAARRCASITALDDGPEIAPAAPPAAIVLRDQVLPGWAVRLLVGALLLPVLLAAVDGAGARAPPPRAGARAGSAGRWPRVPFLLAGAVRASRCGWSACVTAPARPCAPGRMPVSGAGAASPPRSSFVLALAAGCGRRWRARAARARRPRARRRAAAASACSTLVARGLVWIVQPVRRAAARPRRAPLAAGRRARGHAPAAALGVVLVAARRSSRSRSRRWATPSRSTPGRSTLLWMGALLVAGRRTWRRWACLLGACVAGCAVAR